MNERACILGLWRDINRHSRSANRRWDLLWYHFGGGWLCWLGLVGEIGEFFLFIFESVVPPNVVLRSNDKFLQFEDRGNPNS